METYDILNMKASDCTMTIGERIRTRREQLNMSQEELAVKLGYKSRSTVNKIEMGGRNLKQSKILAIANALETTPEYIMGWEETTETQQSNEFSLIDAIYYNLNEENRRQLEKYAEFLINQQNEMEAKQDSDNLSNLNIG